MSQDNSPEKKHHPISEDFLIRGSDYLAWRGDKGFKLVGREEELVAAGNTLMRKDNNNLLIYGPPGVGVSSIVLGLQASKESLDTPFDIVGKRFYFLDTDALFSSGDTAKINAGFQKAMQTLTRAPDTVLVIDDVKDFLDGIRNTGTSNLVNLMMREARSNPRFQVILESRDENLADLFKSHSDIAEIFSLQEVREPGKDALKLIMKDLAKDLEDFHGIPITQEAIDAVTELTTKYPGLTLNTAQPKRSKMILEGALIAYKRREHSKPGTQSTLETEIDALAAALNGGKPVKGFEDKSPEELQALKIEKEAALTGEKEKFDALQKRIRALYKELRTGEEEIIRINREISKTEENEKLFADAQEALKKAQSNEEKQKIRQDYFDKTGDRLADLSETKSTAAGAFATSLSSAGYKSDVVQKLVKKREQYESIVAETTATYKKLTQELNAGLTVTADHVLAEFSRLSGLPVDKLNEDETEKLLSLDATLKGRVFGQDEAVEAVADYVRAGRAGLKADNKPVGSFLFIGPSGTGKTELVKALAQALYNDERLINRFNMTDYKEKTSINSLIGAPRGYEGFAEGGLLTNSVRRRPNSVNLFDEIEKAHTEVFDILMAVFDEGILADTKGAVATFGGCVNIMTSNIGSHHFMDPNLSYEEAVERAKADLYNNDKSTGGSGLRLEFLNRIDGIYFFKSLEVAQIILIAAKNLKELNQQLAKREVVVKMSAEDISAMCDDNYQTMEQTRMGGRGIRKYINDTIKPAVTKTLLTNKGQPGTITVTYNRSSKKPEFSFAPKETPVANDAVKPVAPQAKPAA